MACYGCGLRINGVDDSLEVATAEEFGAGDLAGFGSDSTVGSPVYCDANGQLRVAPGHTSDTFVSSGGQGSTALPDGGAATGATTTMVINNPSSLRAASVFGSASVIEQLGFPMGNVTFSPALDVTRNGVPIYAITGLFTFQGNPIYASSYWWTYDASFTDAIAAGGSVTYVATCSADVASGTSGDFSSAVGIRGLVVTQ